jgi:uncharacterized protein YecE (DUF72 family)
MGACVPDDFPFAVKVPKAITQEASLADCGTLLDRFVDEVTGLEEKLGVLLVQLPPTSAQQAPRQSFLPRSPRPHRHRCRAGTAACQLVRT